MPSKLPVIFIRTDNKKKRWFFEQAKRHEISVSKLVIMMRNIFEKELTQNQIDDLFKKYEE